jgi:cytoskeleton protein RodZ
MVEDNSSAAMTAPEKRSVGEMLKESRNAQGLSLEQISTELRIEVPQLEALEGDRFERIGVPVFVKGYLRQYGTRLGLDPRDLLAQYYAQTSLKEVQIQPSKTIKLRDERQITVWVIAALAILVVVVGLAAWWVGAGGSTVASSPSAAPKTSVDAKPASAAPAAAPESTSAPAVGTPTGGSAAPPAEPAPSSAPATPATAPPPSGTAAPATTPTPSGTVAPVTTPTPSGTAPAAPPSPASGASTGTTTLAVATPPPAARAAAERPAAQPTAAAPTTSAASPVTATAASSGSAPAAQPGQDDAPPAILVVPLELTFEQESWAEVTDARGERLYYGLGTAGKQAQVRGAPPFAVVLGNAGGVKIVVDGEDFAVPAKGKPGEYARFSVNVVSD